MNNHQSYQWQMVDNDDQPIICYINMADSIVAFNRRNTHYLLIPNRACGSRPQKPYSGIADSGMAAVLKFIIQIDNSYSYFIQIRYWHIAVKELFLELILFGSIEMEMTWLVTKEEDKQEVNIFGWQMGKKEQDNQIKKPTGQWELTCKQRWKLDRYLRYLFHKR